MKGDTYVTQNIDLTNVNNISFWGYLQYAPGSEKYTQYFDTYIDGNLVQAYPCPQWATWVQDIVPISGYTGVHTVQVTYVPGVVMDSYIDDISTGGTSGGSATAPFASFTATPVNGIASLTVQFTDTSAYTPTSWLWDFGDGSTSTAENPSHIYISPGTYPVNLTATNTGGSNSKVKTGLVYVAASTGALPNYNGIYVRAANHDGIRWDTVGNGTYYIAPSTSTGGGLSTIHISTDTAVTAGQVTSPQNPSGTFYLTANSLTYQDEGVLLLGVTGTIPNDFAAHITTSGYTWTPTGSAPASANYTYQSSALDQTFTKSDFFYGPQNWKPTQGNANYPLFYGEDMNSSANQYQLMFIDTRAGILGNSSLTNQGAIQINYSFTDLPGTATFNVYGWRSGSGQGMQWTNDVTTGGNSSSGYTVSTKTPTAPPVAGFVANQTQGLAPFNARFTDTTNNTPTAWYWTFGDGGTSTSQNPAYTYTSAGTYSVTLTASNSAGSDKITRSGYITVSASVPTTTSFNLAGITTDNSGSGQKVSIAAANTTIDGNVVNVTVRRQHVGSPVDHHELDPDI